MPASPRKIRIIATGQSKRRKNRNWCPVFFELDRRLYLASKTEAYRQGFSFRDVVEHLLKGWLEESPSWREFLAQQAEVPLPKQRGRPRG